MVFTGDFISDEMKYFQFGVRSISFICLPEIPRNETHFILGDKGYIKTTPKGNICAYKHFIYTIIIDQKIKIKMNFSSFRLK